MAQYQVLARKWRPQQFDDVVGQEHITQTLVNAIKSKRIAHAYLLVGPRGTGKTTTARILAKALNCEKGPTPTPCDKCAACQEITAGSSLNVLEYDAASNTQVDKIRELIIENVKYSPTSGKYKIYIVDEVHMLSGGSFNALLKTLEEPPEHVIFVFATTEVSKLPLTILSRCQRFDFRRLATSLIVKHLATIAKDEKVQIEESALLAIARGSEGCMRDALSTTDQLISFCGSKIAEDDVLGMFGLAAHERIVELAGAILEGKTREALKMFNDLAESGKDLQRLLTEMIEHFRNLLVVKMAGEQSGAVDATDAELAELRKQSASVDADALLRVLEVLTGAEGRLKYTASKRILFEVTLIKASQARETASIDVVLQKLNSLRGGGSPPTSGAVAAASAKPVAASKPAAAQAPKHHQDAVAEPPPTPAYSTSADQMQAVWAYVHEHFAQAAPLGREFLNQGRPLSFDGRVFTIGFDPEFKSAMDFLNSPRFRAVLQTKLRECLGHDVGLHFELAEDTELDAPKSEPPASEIAAPTPAPIAPTAPPPATKPSAPAPSSRDAKDFRNDPLIKKALEIFRGQIVTVRA
ncbi:MAG: DNA polymerase III subunit gamma/tau [Verrucomicrobia bacterium]|nr:DNA polymerase III subunit gamma/tau [Verrucomicrobiota bacterium]